MYYTIKEIAEKSDLSEHTIRFYTNENLLPCLRDSNNRRIFDENSLNWLKGIKCLKKCGMSLDAIKHYCHLCMDKESKENLTERYNIILKYKVLAYEKLQEAKDLIEYMENKTKHYEDILNNLIPDDTNPFELPETKEEKECI